MRYDLRFKNPRKATGPGFIPVKVIKFTSNIIDSHQYNLMIKDLEKTNTKTELVRPMMKESILNGSKHSKWNV